MRQSRTIMFDNHTICSHAAKLFQICNNSQSEFVGGVLTAKIFGSDFAGFQYTINGLRYHVTVIV